MHRLGIPLFLLLFSLSSAWAADPVRPRIAGKLQADADGNLLLYGTSTSQQYGLIGTPQIIGQLKGKGPFLLEVDTLEAMELVVRKVTPLTSLKDDKIPEQGVVQLVGTLAKTRPADEDSDLQLTEWFANRTLILEGKFSLLSNARRNHLNQMVILKAHLESDSRLSLIEIEKLGAPAEKEAPPQKAEPETEPKPEPEIPPTNTTSEAPRTRPSETRAEKSQSHWSPTPRPKPRVATAASINHAFIQGYSDGISPSFRILLPAPDWNAEEVSAFYQGQREGHQAALARIREGVRGLDIEERVTLPRGRGWANFGRSADGKRTWSSYESVTPGGYSSSFSESSRP